jgi:hypothetical protein
VNGIAGIVKRISNILKYLGLSRIAFGFLLTLVLVYVFRGPSMPTGAVSAIAFCVFTFFIGCLFALCGLLQCEVSAFQKTAFVILKYFGIFCLVFGLWLAITASSEAQASGGIITLSSGSLALVIAALYAFAKSCRATTRP